MGWRDRAKIETAQAPQGWRTRMTPDAPGPESIAPEPYGPENLEVGPKETFALRGADAIPLGGLLTDLASTAAMEYFGGGTPGARLTPSAQAELKAMGEKVDPQPDLVDVYRRLRDTRKLRTVAGSNQNKTAGRLGAATGIGASLLAPLPSVRFAPIRGIPLVAGERLARVLGGVATGSAYGALNGATEGSADLTRGEVGRAVGETTVGALGGGILGGTAAAAAEALRDPLQRAVQYGADRLRGSALGQGRRVISGQSDIAAATRTPLSDAAVEEALQSKAIRPLSTTAATYERLADMADEQGALYGRVLKELEDAGVQGPRALELADDLMARYRDRYKNSGANKDVANVFQGEAVNIVDLARGVDDAALKGIHGPVRERLPLMQAENLKRDMQVRGRHERINANPKEEAYQEIGSTLRQGIEDSVADAGRNAPVGSPLRELSASFVPVKQRTGRLLEARDAAERGASKAAQRSPTSIKDMILGAAGDGGMLTAQAKALMSALGRNRLPSLGATATYGASQRLRNAAPLSPEEIAQLAAFIYGDSENSTRATTVENVRRSRRPQEQP